MPETAAAPAPAIESSNGAHHVLIVDDEHDVVDLLRYNLTQAGYRVSECFDGLAALELARRSRPDLIVLDLMLPQMDGLTVFENLRRDDVTARIPVIMLTAKTSQTDREKGLETGADDYLGKPFSPKELVLRVRSVLRRSDFLPTQQDYLEVDQFRLDKNAMSFFAGEAKIDLTPIEFKLLTLLVESRGRTLSREELLQRVWGYSSTAYTRTVDTHIKRLRDKLGDASSRIETTRGEGYRFAMD